MLPAVTDDIDVGDEVRPFVRVTDFAEWNRYAAVNDEFIDVHMSADAARAAGQPDVFGMGNLRIAYAHNALHDWLDGRGDIAEFACQFRGMNFRGDELSAWGRVTAAEHREGLRCADLEMGVRNQGGEETMPATATVVLFSGEPRMPEPPPPAAVPVRAPGVYLDEQTIGWLGRPTEPVVSYPVDASDIRRWAQAVYHPERAPADFMDRRVAMHGPWSGIVAARDFNPFAWVEAYRPDAYPWMRGMGTEPGYRGLNGGQRNRSFAPIRPGDVITSVATLVDAFEKEGKLGPMMFLVDESRWTNQHGELVRIGTRTSIYH
jgi:acyl dehydratase